MPTPGSNHLAAPNLDSHIRTLGQILLHRMDPPLLTGPATRCSDFVTAFPSSVAADAGGLRSEAEDFRTDGYSFETREWLSQSSKRVSAMLASSPGTSVRSSSLAPK
jgi:hypothetical protein